MGLGEEIYSVDILRAVDEVIREAAMLTFMGRVKLKGKVHDYYKIVPRSEITNKEKYNGVLEMFEKRGVGAVISKDGKVFAVEENDLGKYLALYEPVENDEE